MALYHINTKGEPGVCQAKKACPFGGAQDHYTSKEAAQTAYDNEMANQALVKVSKPAAVGTRNDAIDLIRESIMKPRDPKPISYDDYMAIPHEVWGSLIDEYDANEEVREFMAIENAYMENVEKRHKARIELEQLEDDIAKLEKQELKISKRGVEKIIAPYHRFLRVRAGDRKVRPKARVEDILKQNLEEGVIKQAEADEVLALHEKYTKANERYQSRLAKATEADPVFKSKRNTMLKERDALSDYYENVSEKYLSTYDYMKSREAAGKTAMGSIELQSHVESYRIVQTAHRMTAPRRVVDGVVLRPGEGLTRGLYKTNGELVGVIKNNLQGPERGFSAVNAQGVRTKFTMPNSVDDEVNYTKLKEQGYVIGSIVTPVNIQKQRAIAVSVRSKAFSKHPIRGLENFDEGARSWAATVKSADVKI